MQRQAGVLGLHFVGALMPTAPSMPSSSSDKVLPGRRRRIRHGHHRLLQLRLRMSQKANQAFCRLHSEAVPKLRLALCISDKLKLWNCSRAYRPARSMPIAFACLAAARSPDCH